ncbi:biotin apo-protein [Grosmannia clavigera kw1407]|uniref:Biotin apo-protein n=1 Tax=Grosmannia clavigera (strain kw1407 / UAMH 11150) TaxID=655863 RepID=F0XQG7_GROCL|nr:biotin apo-protein [Grosmannia clavigera kw1407]EFX00081.1 biotin apo-protein [Grosmannia clavigera kw1407]
MAARKLNVLVYSGTGTTSESARHCLLALRRLLYPNHAVIPINEAGLTKEPWPATCALLVMPGGADLGYCRVLNGAANRRISQYVRGGGHYLGFCAGGYYGSGVCEFEVGNPALEVVGRRELVFFPGICRGGAYEGFSYRDESGARAVQLAIHTDSFGAVSDTLPSTCCSYYNGGGVFVDAAIAANVQVLASYPDDIAVDGGSNGGRAAVVYCAVGEGAALLTGPHPEFEPANLSEQPDLPGYSAILAELRHDDELQARSRFLRACLVKLGLDVGSGNVALPRLTSLHVTSLYPDEAQELVQAWDEVLTREGNDMFFRGGDTFRVLQPDVGTSAWPAALNTAVGPGKHQPFCTAMLMDLADRALRYPKLAALIKRVAAINNTSAPDEDQNTFRAVLGAVAAHEEEGGNPSAERGDSSQRRALFDDMVDAIRRAVAQVLPRDGAGAMVTIPELDLAVRQEIWAGPQHSGTAEDDDNETVRRLIVYEATWPTRVAAFDYGTFYRALEHYRQTLPTSATDGHEFQWGNQLMYGRVVGSTNTLLERNGRLTATLPTGFTLTATTQLAGRGRGANVWLAPDGQLILSTVIHHPLRFAAGADRPVVFLQYLAAIAIVEAVEAYGPGFDRLGVRLKWPNDVYAPDPDAKGGSDAPYVKIGGILAHCSYADGHYQVVLGIGLNATNGRPTTSLAALAARHGLGLGREQPANDAVVLERLLACLLTRLEAVYRQFCRDGFSGDLETRYYRHWLHADQVVTLEAVVGQPRARVLGITPDWGLLRVAEVVSDGPGTTERSTGRVWKLQSDENSFDYWKGLIRTKT